MKINRLGVMIAGMVVMIGFASCKKEECHECHYDLNGTEVELGEKCGKDLEAIEKSGIEVSGTVYEVHCHEH